MTIRFHNHHVLKGLPEKFANLIFLVLKRTPHPFIWCLSNVIGYLISLVPMQENKVARLHIQKIFTGAPTQSIIRKMYSHLTQALLEAPQINKNLHNKFEFEIINEESILEIKRLSNNGILALTAHTMYWDLLAAWCIHRGFNVSTIGRKARNKFFQQLLEKIRDGYGIKTLWRDSRVTKKDIFSKLGDGDIVAALIDQDTRVKSVYVPFFGVTAKTPSTLTEIALERDTTIVSAFIFRTTKRHFKIFLNILHTQGQTHTAVEILSNFNHNLETHIKEFPEQWVWFHKRWRSQANGEVFRTKEYCNYLQNNFKLKSLS